MFQPWAYTPATDFSNTYSQVVLCNSICSVRGMSSEQSGTWSKFFAAHVAVFCGSAMMASPHSTQRDTSLARTFLLSFPPSIPPGISVPHPAWWARWKTVAHSLSPRKEVLGWRHCNHRSMPPREAPYIFQMLHASHWEGKHRYCHTKASTLNIKIAQPSKC